MNIDTRPLMVTIRCITYNHEKYIRQCLEGFVMQKTHFRFEAIVHDDASTDGTADIIREYEAKYPDIIKPIYETENQYSKHDGSLRHIMDKHTHGKYIAICEGDDYWIDPFKLQKQVDFLESHPDYGVVHTNRYSLRDNKLLKVKARMNYDAVSVLLSTGIATLTTCYRSELYFKYCKEIQPETKGWLMGDSPLWKYIAFNSKIHLLPDYTAVYRVLEESASHSKNIEKRISFEKSVYEIQLFIWNLYVKGKENSERVKCQIISNHNLRIFDIYIAYGYKKKAVDYLKKNIKDLIVWDLLKISELRKIVSAVVSVLLPVRNK